MANCHTVIRHRIDPSLEGTIQHQWKFDKMNVKPEIWWSYLRTNFTRGFEDILDQGLTFGLYDPNNPLESLIFRYISIPWLQAELDNFVSRFNNSPRRANRRKILPHGVPNLINSKPHLFGAKDFRVIVGDDLFNEMEREWCPPELEVFKLVPDVFQFHIERVYQAIGSPEISSNNFWTVYSLLCDEFKKDDCVDDPQMHEAFQRQQNLDPLQSAVDIPVLPGLAPLRNDRYLLGVDGDIYLGGAPEHMGFTDENRGRTFVDFSDSDDE
jgi:hypothetical protein